MQRLALPLFVIAVNSRSYERRRDSTGAEQKRGILLSRESRQRTVAGCGWTISKLSRCHFRVRQRTDPLRAGLDMCRKKKY